MKFFAMSQTPDIPKVLRNEFRLTCVCSQIINCFFGRLNGSIYSMNFSAVASVFMSVLDDNVFSLITGTKNSTVGKSLKKHLVQFFLHLLRPFSPQLPLRFVSSSSSYGEFFPTGRQPRP